MREHLNAIWEKHSGYLERLEKLLEETARWLDIPVYLIKGKRLRAISSNISCTIFGVNEDVSVLSGYALEMIHAASLIHDDIVDEADTRRGGRTLNDIFSIRRAVLVGDLVFTRALSEVAKVNVPLYLSSMSDTVYKMAYGQYLEDVTPPEKFDEHLYLEVIYNKTASLYELAFVSGSLIVGRDDPYLREAGKSFGMAFQILDDWDDYEEDVGKPTLPHIYERQGHPDPRGTTLDLAKRYLERVEWELERGGFKDHFTELIDYMWSRI